MTATLIIVGEVLEHERNAEFRRSASQRDMLRTLNTLFDELNPAMIAKEDLIDLRNHPSEACDVSRVVRD